MNHLLLRRDTRKVATSSLTSKNADYSPTEDTSKIEHLPARSYQDSNDAIISYGSISSAKPGNGKARNTSSPVSILVPENPDFHRTEQNHSSLKELHSPFAELTLDEEKTPDSPAMQSSPTVRRPDATHPLIREQSDDSLENTHDTFPVHDDQAQESKLIASLEMDTIDEMSPRRRRPSRPTHRRRHSSDVKIPKPVHHRRHSSSIPAFRQDTELESLKKTLQLRERQLGPHSPRVANIHNLIGNYHFRARQLELAQEAYQKAILCARGAKAPVDYSPIALAFGNLATVHRSMGDGEQSSMCLEKALNLHIYIAKGQYKDPNTCVEVADCLYQVGLTQILRELHSKALDTLSHCRLIREQILGKNHVDVARAIDAMGTAYRGLEEYDKAMQCHQEALEMKRNSGFGLGTSGYLMSLKNIAEVHEARHALGDAIAVYLKMNKLQIKELARARLNRTQADPGVTRLALETGETLLKLKELYSSTGNEVEGVVKGREAALYLREAGVADDDTRMLTCWVRGTGVWNSV